MSQEIFYALTMASCPGLFLCVHEVIKTGIFQGMPLPLHEQMANLPSILHLIIVILCQGSFLT